MAATDLLSRSARPLMAPLQALSLRARVTVFLTLYIAGTIAVVSGVVLHLENQRALTEARTDADNILHEFAKTLYGRWDPARPGTLNRRALEDSGIKDLFYNKPNIAYAAFQDPRGRLLYVPRRVSTFGWMLDRTQLDQLTQRRLAITGSTTRPFYEEPEGLVQERLLEVRGKTGHTLGVLRLGLREARIRHTLDEGARDTLFKLPLLILAVTALSSLIVFLLAAWLESPLKALQQRARKLLGDRADAKSDPQALLREFEGIEKMVQGLKQNRTELVGTISHDLRSPIQSIVGYVYFLRHGGAGPISADVDRYLQVIHDNADHFANFIDNVLDLIRLDRNKLTVERVPISIAQVARQSIKLSEARAKERQIALSESIAPEADAALGDAGRVVQVLTNLIGNALKFTPAGGSIRVGAEVKDGRVEVYVKDTGPGIPKEAQAHVFEEFYQVPGVEVVRGPKGLGIGLTLCHRLIEAQGGRIWIEGGPGEGTTVRFSLNRQVVPEAQARA